MSGKRAKAIRKAVKKLADKLPDATYKAPVHKVRKNAAGQTYIETTEQEFPVNKLRRITRDFKNHLKRHGK